MSTEKPTRPQTLRVLRIAIATGGFLLIAASGWSQVTAINDLSDASTPPDGNLYLGSGSGASHTTGFLNTGVGIEALLFLTRGGLNTAVGANALRQTSTGSGNTAVGYSAMDFNSTGSFNTAIGEGALSFNTRQKANTAVGYSALQFSTGSRNTGVGMYALLDNDGKENTASGFGALRRNESGDRNLALGAMAGGQNISGSRNVFIGHNAGNNSDYESLDQQLVIANSRSRVPLIQGDFRDRTLTVNGDLSASSFITISDIRLKRSIRPLEGALGSMLRLEGKSFSWRKEEHPELALAEGRDIGLIAQEVEEVLPELILKQRHGYKAIAYQKLSVILVEAVKEQQAQITEQRELLARQQTKIAALLKRVAELELASPL